MPRRAILIYLRINLSYVILKLIYGAFLCVLVYVPLGVPLDARLEDSVILI